MESSVIGVPDSLLVRLGFDSSEWIETCSDIGLKLEAGVKRLKATLDKHYKFSTSRICIGHSGGKDSCLVTYMARSWKLSLVCLHTPKVEGANAVHEITRRFLYEHVNNVLYLKGIPHPFDCQIDGTRIAENNRTDGRSTTVNVSGQEISREAMSEWSARGLFNMRFAYPIFDWSDIEVWAALHVFNIPYSREYLLP